MTENQISEEVRKHLQSKIRQQLNVLKAPDFWGQSWSFRKECPIQFGSNIGRADLVLLLNNKPFVIVECKRLEAISHGKEQLESYLNASRAGLGIFANNPDPQKWSYYDNSIGFDEIDRLTFYREIRKAHETELDIEKEAQRIKLKRIEARVRELVTPKAIHEATQARSVMMIDEQAKERVTEDAIQEAVAQQLETRASELVNANSEVIQERADKIIEAQAKIRVTEKAIQGAVAQQLQEKIKQQESIINWQQTALDESRNNAMWGWILFGISVVLFIVAANS